MGSVKTTALILTYNQEDYIQDAIESVVNQTLQPDEILISDDCSTDSTFHRAQQVVEEVQQSGRFKGTVCLNRNEKNLGFIPHFNWAVQACSGHLILYNAGDDTSMPNRLETFGNAYHDRGYPRYFLGHSSVQIKGGPQDGGIWVPPVEQAQFPIERLANSAALHIGAAQCFTKALFSDFGPIRFEDAYEDLILGFRALLTDSYWYSPNPLLTYRVGGLTFWQKNTWEKKRRRYKAVLSQRSLDAMRSGRQDLLDEIFMAFLDFGFVLPDYPKRVRVISETVSEELFFDYSIERHFDRLEHLIIKEPLEKLTPFSAESLTSYDLLNTLVFLRVMVLGWSRIIQYLEILNKTGFYCVVDCGIRPFVWEDLKSNKDLFDRVLDLFKDNPSYRITASCNQVGVDLRSYFKGSFFQSPLLFDVDGFRGPQVRSTDESELSILMVQLGYELNASNVISIEHVIRSLLHTTQKVKIKIFISKDDFSSVSEELLGLTKYFTIEFFYVKNIGASQLVNFDHFLIVDRAYEHHTTLTEYLSGLLVSQGFPTSIIYDETFRTVVGQSDFDLARADLYFKQSIQKQVDKVTNLIAALLDRGSFAPRLLPL